MQIITIFQPEAIVKTGEGGQIVTVELGQTETRVILRQDQTREKWIVPSTAYLSDEADHHHDLQSIDMRDGELVLTFQPLPSSTRVFDLEGDSHHRWIGVHSGVRTIDFPTVLPKYDESSKIADFIEGIIRVNSLEKELGNDSLYLAIHDRLPLLRDYVVWKWKLSPHEAFVLRQKQERPLPVAVSTRAKVSAPSTRSSDSRVVVNNRMPKPRKSLFRRLNPRPLSRFEQKTLQETRVK